MICMRIIWCTMWPLLVSLCDLYDSILYHPLYNETCNIYLHFYLKLPSHYLQVFTWAKLDCTGDTWLRWGWQCFHFCTYFRILIKTEWNIIRKKLITKLIILYILSHHLQIPYELAKYLSIYLSILYTYIEKHILPKIW